MNKKTKKLELFVVEKGVTPPSRSTKLEANIVRSKINKLAPTMEIGDSFLVNSSSLRTARDWLKTQYPEMLFKSADAVENKKDKLTIPLTRIWRTK